MKARMLIESEIKRPVIYDLWDTEQPVPLPDGDYDALRYGYVAEINGTTFRTKGGCRCTRSGFGAPQRVRLEGGKIMPYART